MSRQIKSSDLAKRIHLYMCFRRREIFFTAIFLLITFTEAKLNPLNIQNILETKPGIGL